MGNKKINHFTDLIVWQKAHELVLFLYKITKTFPAEEKFGLTIQMRRSSVSITSNIAEGFGRNTIKDKVQFYTIAKGSLFELESQLFIARDSKYLSPDYHKRLSGDLDTISRPLTGLKRSAIDK